MERNGANDIYDLLEKQGFLSKQLLSSHYAVQVMDQVRERVKEFERWMNLGAKQMHVNIEYAVYDQDLRQPVHLSFHFLCSDVNNQMKLSGVYAETGKIHIAMDNLMRCPPLKYNDVKNDLKYLLMMSPFRLSVEAMLTRMSETGFSAIKYGGGKLTVLDRIKDLGDKVEQESLAKGDSLFMLIPGTYQYQGKLIEFKIGFEMSKFHDKCECAIIQSSYQGTVENFFPSCSHHFEAPEMMSLRTIEKHKLEKAAKMLESRPPAKNKNKQLKNI